MRVIVLLGRPLLLQAGAMLRNNSAGLRQFGQERVQARRQQTRPSLSWPLQLQMQPTNSLQPRKLLKVKAVQQQVVVVVVGRFRATCCIALLLKPNNKLRRRRPNKLLVAGCQTMSGIQATVGGPKKAAWLAGCKSSSSVVKYALHALRAPPELSGVVQLPGQPSSARMDRERERAATCCVVAA